MAEAVGWVWLVVAAPVRGQHVHAAVSAPVSPSGTAVTAPVLAAPPVVDGILNPGEWEEASVLTGFIQKEPREGDPMSERTEVRVARHGDRLFVAFLAYDRDMSRVRAELTPRDRYEDAADVVAVVLDPVQGRSRGYVFFFNPLGVQYDGVWTRREDFGWDGVVESRGRVEADRYVVEVAIPFATVLTGGNTGGAWNVNFGRRIPRKNEEGWWVPVPRSDSWRMLAHMGELRGMDDAVSRTRFELIPTATAQGAREGGVSDEVETSWGATLRAPLTESVRVEATYQPDFTFVETDAPQIGFNERFALFYPEKRPFFLEAADRFGTRAASFVSDPLNLVHTRTIVRPRAGARLLASPGGGFVGGMLLSGREADGGGDGTAAVLRAAVDRTSGAIAGVTVTHRDRGRRRNTVMAADAQGHLPADVVLTVQGAHSVTHEGGAGGSRRGSAAYVDIARESEGGVQQLVYRRVERDFETDLGFIPRGDVQYLLGHAGFYWRPRIGPLLSVFPMTQNFVLFDAAGRRLEVEHLPHVEVLLTRMTKLWMGYRFGEESYRGREYTQARYEARVSATPFTWMDVAFGAKTGRRIRYDLEIEGQDETFLASFREGHAEAALRPDGATTISVAGVWRRLGGNRTLAPRAAWVTRASAIRFLSNSDYLRVVAQYDRDQGRREASLLLGRELNYGTQVHLGVDYSSAREGTKGTRVVRASFFTRVSYLMHR